MYGCFHPKRMLFLSVTNLDWQISRPYGIAAAPLNGPIVIGARCTVGLYLSTHFLDLADSCHYIYSNCVFFSVSAASLVSHGDRRASATACFYTLNELHMADIVTSYTMLTRAAHG